MMKYEINDFNNVILFVWNRGIDEFIKMYAQLGFTSQSYAEEKFQKARDMFAIWWLNLDAELQDKIINYVKDYYGVKNV